MSLMTRLYPFKGLILNPEGKIPVSQKRLYLPRETAFNRLKQLTGQDFGYDAEAWKKWFKENNKK
jgi:hypothetical protein